MMTYVCMLLPPLELTRLMILSLTLSPFYLIYRTSITISLIYIMIMPVAVAVEAQIHIVPNNASPIMPI